MLKYLALGLFACSVARLAQRGHEAAARWWRGRIDEYARWVSLEFEAMFEEVTLERARRIITLAVLTGFVAGFLLGGGFFSRLLLSLIGAVLGYHAPRVVTRYLQQRRLKKIDSQLVDALVLLSNSLKSGLSLQQAFEMIVREMRPPISDELGRVVKEIQLGRLTDDALLTLTERVPLDDVKLAVGSIITLRETGGNLSETFEVIAHTIGERKKVEGKISSMTAQGMTQGVVMCLMPLAMIGLFTLMDPEYMEPLFTTPLGVAMLVVVFVLDAAGLWMMRKLVQVDV